MIPVTPNPMLGVGLHAVGGFFAANCYAPQKYVKRWSWEIYWLTQAAWCWFLWPILGASAPCPICGRCSPMRRRTAMLSSFLMGMAYGIGGTAFNVSIRYIGFSLTYAIAVGLSSVSAPLSRPWYAARSARFSPESGPAGCSRRVAAGALGIALCGVAGRFKESDLAASTAARASSPWSRACCCRCWQACSRQCTALPSRSPSPMVDVAEQHGAGIWKGNVAYLFANTGAFVTAAIYSLYLARKNNSLGELSQLRSGKRPSQPVRQLPPGLPHRHPVVRPVLLLQPGPRPAGPVCVHQLGHPHDHAGADQQPGGHVFQGMEGLRGRTEGDHRPGLVVLVLRS